MNPINIMLIVVIVLGIPSGNPVLWRLVLKENLILVDCDIIVE